MRLVLCSTAYPDRRGIYANNVKTSEYVTCQCRSCGVAALWPSELKLIWYVTSAFATKPSRLRLISLVMLNERIRALRLAKGLTLQQVGDVFGISRASVSNWEAGHAHPDPRKIEGLAKLFDTTVQYLLSGEHTSPAKVSKATFQGVPFVSFVKFNNSNESLQALCSQSQKFAPMSFGFPSPTAFCTDFPPPTENLANRLIPPGATVFLDPEITMRNHAVVLVRKIDGHVDFYIADLSSSTIKLRSLTKTQPSSYTPETLEEILGVATHYSLSINL